jgi:benzoyl-CoA-dihydrodiol lyase
VKPLDAERALELGLVTFAPDELDWDDEIRLSRRGARDAFARCADRHGGEPALSRRRDARNQGLRPPLRLAKLGLHPAQSTGERGALKLFGTGSKPDFDWKRV